jgi:hypothetical protein
MAKRFDPKAKARKQKILAAVLGVVFLGVVAFQAPTILGLFKGSSSTASSEPAPTPTPAPSPAPAASAAAAAAPAAAPAPAGELIDSDVAPEPAEGQLVTFDRFESKDPFVQQVGDASAAPTGGSEPTAASPPQKDGIAAASPPRPRRVDAQRDPPAPPQARTATMSVNGVSQEVGVSATFPEGEPVFKLVKLTRTAAKIGIVGGTYATGSQTVTLRKGGKPLTLMNTADGTTYVLRLVDVG